MAKLELIDWGSVEADLAKEREAFSAAVAKVFPAKAHEAMPEEPEEEEEEEEEEENEEEGDDGI